MVTSTNLLPINNNNKKKKKKKEGKKLERIVVSKCLDNMYAEGSMQVL